jgi:hypothetical protein
VARSARLGPTRPPRKEAAAMKVDDHHGRQTALARGAASRTSCGHSRCKSAPFGAGADQVSGKTRPVTCPGDEATCGATGTRLLVEASIRPARRSTISPPDRRRHTTGTSPATATSTPSSCSAATTPATTWTFRGRRDDRAADHRHDGSRLLAGSSCRALCRTRTGDPFLTMAVRLVRGRPQRGVKRPAKTPKHDSAGDRSRWHGPASSVTHWLPGQDSGRARLATFGRPRWPAL